jgi:transcriptional regulator with PAS, ATPase and Fis domain
MVKNARALPGSAIVQDSPPYPPASATGVEEKLQLARNLFSQGRSLPPGLVRPVILESWRRCQTYGLSFNRHSHQLLSPEELRRRLELRRTLCEVAEPIMDELHQFTTGSGFVSTLTEEEGYVLKIMGDDEIVRMVAEDNHMVEGCNRSEQVVGTNGIGTTLATGHPLQVFAGEHYYPLNAMWICSGAPIVDARGRTIAVFCLTGLREKVSFHTLGMAVAAAKAVSRQLTLQQALETVEKIRDQMGTIVETVPTGIMLLGREQKILQINDKTADLLLRPAPEILGRNFYDIFDRNSLDTGARKGQIDGRTVAVGQGRSRLYFSMDMRRTSHGEAVITLEKVEAHRRRVNQVIGATARFTFSDIIGRSPAITSAMAMARIAAENDSKVLLTGESGTGKELFAQAIHNAGPRRDGPFIAVNCGAIPRSLIESELFGYERGTFTGASDEGRAGKFELADGGTIFLDEIGDMPLDVQITLLRVLQNQEVCRLGGQTPLRVNVRIIAATNRNLLKAITENTFRRDLYYRLNVFSIHIPSLRERRGDVRLLADHFLGQYAHSAGKNIQGFSENAYRLLEGHDWRGNVRELENAVEQAIYMASEEIDIDDLNRLTYSFGDQTSPSPPKKPQLTPAEARPGRTPRLQPRVDRLTVEKSLISAGGNIKKAAALLGVSRRTMYRKLQLFGIDYDTIRAGRTRGGPA